MRKICLSFTNFTEVNFLKKGQFIYTSLDGNPSYTTLAALLVVLKIALDKYAADLAAAATNDRNAISQKNKSMAELDALLKQLGLAVMAEAKGDETTLTSSGYTLAKEPEAIYIFNPGNVTCMQGISSGQMISMIKAMNGAKSYVHQIADEFPDDESKWVSVTTSSCKHVFTNLIPGKQYWVRVAVIGSRKQIAYSTVATWFAQ